MKNTTRTFNKEVLRGIVDVIKRYYKMAQEYKFSPKIASAPQHKVGDIPRWSMPPLFTCQNCAECKKHCYALKDYTGIRISSVAKNHTRNMHAVIEDLGRTEKYITKWIQRRKPAFFRIHPSGDFAIPHYGYRYAGMWYRIAQACPETRFLAFTKCYDIVRKVPFYELENFSLVLSEWTDKLEAPADLKEYYRTSRAVVNLEDARDNEIICPGNCETCGMCWALSKLGKDVAFEIH